MLIPHTLDDVADGPELGVSAFSRRALVVPIKPSFTVLTLRASITDAKKKAQSGSLGGRAASDWALGTHCHSETLSDQRPHLRPV